MKRWLAILIIALILGTLGIALHQTYLEAIGLVLIILSIAAFIWSWIRLSFEIRPRPRRRLRRVDRLVGSDGVRKSRTEALHDVIFRRNPHVE